MVFTNDLRPRAHVKRGTDDLLPTMVRRGATLGAGTVDCMICSGAGGALPPARGGAMPPA